MGPAGDINTHQNISPSFSKVALLFPALSSSLHPPVALSGGALPHVPSAGAAVNHDRADGGALAGGQKLMYLSQSCR